MKLLINGLIKLIFGIALIGLMLFLPAQTWNYFGAWLFCGVLFIPVIIMGVIMYLKAPSLLEKRLSNKEKEATQKGVIALSGLMFIGGFLLSSFDFRFGWSHVPTWATIAAAVVFLAGYGMFAKVTRENAYLSRTVEVQEGQKVVSTGLYGVVRHPMYFATLLMFLPIPLVLQSFWGLIPMALYPVVIVIRILNEEKVLEEGLEGYSEYKKRVKYRLIPFIW